MERICRGEEGAISSCGILAVTLSLSYEVGGSARYRGKTEICPFTRTSTWTRPARTLRN